MKFESKDFPSHAATGHSVVLLVSVPCGIPDAEIWDLLFDRHAASAALARG